MTKEEASWIMGIHIPGSLLRNSMLLQEEDT